MKAVLSPPAVFQSLEGDRVRPGRHVERRRWSIWYDVPEGVKVPTYDAVDQDPEVLPRRLVVAPLGGGEGQDVGAGRPVGDGLAHRAGRLEEGDLGALAAPPGCPR